MLLILVLIYFGCIFIWLSIDWFQKNNKNDNDNEQYKSTKQCKSFTKEEFEEHSTETFSETIDEKRHDMMEVVHATKLPSIVKAKHKLALALKKLEQYWDFKEDPETFLDQAYYYYCCYFVDDFLCWYHDIDYSIPVRPTEKYSNLHFATFLKRRYEICLA